MFIKRKNLKGNRNPYIDEPQLINVVWGNGATPDSNPKLKGFPCKGILQFYIACNNGGTLGSNLQSPDKGESFRVIYHENIDYSLNEDKSVSNFKFN